MKIENLWPAYLVHTYGVLALLSAMALLGYEIAKPNMERPVAQTTQAKLSALTSPPVGATVLYPYQPPGRAERKCKAYHAAKHRAKGRVGRHQYPPSEVSGNQYPINPLNHCQLSSLQGLPLYLVC